MTLVFVFAVWEVLAHEYRLTLTGVALAFAAPPACVRQVIGLNSVSSTRRRNGVCLVW